MKVYKILFEISRKPSYDSAACTVFIGINHAARTKFLYSTSHILQHCSYKTKHIVYKPLLGGFCLVCWSRCNALY